MRSRPATGLTAALVVVLALLYVWIGVTAEGWDRVWGVGGGILVLTALAVAGRSRSAALVVMVAGAVPLAVGTWWSIATPLLAVLVVVLGTIATRPSRRRAMVPSSVTVGPVAELRGP